MAPFCVLGALGAKNRGILRSSPAPRQRKDDRKDRYDRLGNAARNHARDILIEIRRQRCEISDVHALIVVEVTCEPPARLVEIGRHDREIADVRGAVAATAYRVAQECLTNSLRHSSAREIVLRIERRTGAEDALLVHVEDDGGGDAAKVAQSPGFGLTGIRERVTALGGSLSIADANRGVSVAATIPLAA